MTKELTLLEKIIYSAVFIGGIYLCISWTPNRPGAKFVGIIAVIFLLGVLSTVSGVVQKLRGGTFLPPKQPDNPAPLIDKDEHFKRLREGRCYFCGTPTLVNIDSKGKASKPKCPGCGSEEGFFPQRGFRSFENHSRA
jgi:hypothetical protein